MTTETISDPRIPVSAYRLQFSRLFQFSDAKKIIPYLSDIGISDMYASPYFKAREGSLHGYDIVDHNTLNLEVGTEEEYHGMIQELWKYGMGQILDIVPNHMCITSKENAWWMDVLENGPGSLYADFFDIDWEPVKIELKNKVLIPVLGNQYGLVLERQELQLVFESGDFFLYYHQYKFPIRPKTYRDILQHRIHELKNHLPPEDPHLNELLSIITALNHLPSYTEKDPEKIAERYREKEIIKKRLWNLYSENHGIKTFIDENVNIFNGVTGKPESFNFLDNLLNQQIYRLSQWSVATEEINYRRFFDINDLAAIRMENPLVFRETHKLIFKLIREGMVTGLRVDHPDGLYNPSEYFQRLQKNCFLYKRLDRPGYVTDTSDREAEILRQYNELLSKNSQRKAFYIIGEKIFIKGEKMPEDWPVFGTTGYVFLNFLNGIFVETTNAKIFDDIYARFIRSKLNFQNIVYEKKKLIMELVMSSEVNTLGHYLNQLSEKNRHTRDFTLNSLTNAIKEAIAFFPIYRTYIKPSEVTERDRRYIEIAVSKAKRKTPAMNESVFDFLKDVLLLKYPENFKDADQREWLDFVMKFQQVTGPVTAKGLEDTTFYIYNRLASLNEVGGSPERFGTPMETFHGQNIERSKFWPHTFIATSTHDTKRSEDVRARINVLSEIPDEWREHLTRWRRLNKKNVVIVEGQTVPDPNEEYLLYQTLIGAWPVEPITGPEYEMFKKRIEDYMVKALREAKVNTSWINPNANYENILMSFIEAILNTTRRNKFLKDFQAFQKQISHYGIYNSLSQTLLKITSPGIPEFYQGTELWDFSLVDPDNRRPVDYSIRIKMLEELKRSEQEMLLSELAKELTINKDNGKIKLYLIYKALNYRKANREIFERGDYSPLEAMGEKAMNVCSFVRQFGNSMALVVAPRFFTRLIQQPERLPFGKEVWKDSVIIVPHEETEKKYRNIFTGEIVATVSYKDATILYLSEIFAHFPVALLEKII
ncbi:MAG: malto-oligosyltrehalose synthase [Candidatus Brocadia sp. AMX2]|uniref:malto-oligosyltrehalose synthase n=1 Tax=Candidatus Brocadia sp. AMX2 TaxID=2293635 RepID=UPI000EE6AE81|nr:malto-oligosyltrehalose synthase [Candidatus Brocadia sp. AMX2]MBC6933136.1 malto-oligosyltrehalose synthase [Candidatus Brocadia sp.]MBL1168384.1 malto-oligosyltrehalose synthase [Candidatus Brocadia sp. AMX1]NOG43206.1 malto-oligosyltrehalose synthase [Planctomycetota bacterium]GIK12442.1 MAG: maltooligosyl trehalose synthase [Candidatus Brocadia sinica]KAA0242864.1 MAG: malto-oligosyltrehalose synthase [Candidatus Brocadia sp. AMX2]